MSDIIKKEDASFSLTKGKLAATKTGFRQRIEEAKARPATEYPNRLALMLDRSGSMSGEPLKLLKEAVANFVQRCNFADTAIALRTFPAGVALDLTNVGLIIESSAQAITAGGGTPMRECLQNCYDLPITRGIIVSDGCATDWREFDDEYGDAVKNVLKPYIDKKIPIDCVHIGDSSSGEALLQRIAELTGGLYIKFTDVSAFSSAFAYLTPGYRAMLTDGTIDASKIGAKEINR